MTESLEELAESFLSERSLGAPVDPRQVAAALGLRVCEAPEGIAAHLIGQTIYVSVGVSPARQAFDILHECGHRLLERAGLPDPEWQVNLLASALLLPRRDFEADLRSSGWDLWLLRERHPSASFEALAWRIASLREAVIWILEVSPEGALVERARGPKRRLFGGALWRPCPAEREAAEAALRFGGPVSSVAGVVAWPLLLGEPRRVLCVSTLESVELSARLALGPLKAGEGNASRGLAHRKHK